MLRPLVFLGYERLCYDATNLGVIRHRAPWHDSGVLECLLGRNLWNLVGLVNGFEGPPSRGLQLQDLLTSVHLFIITMMGLQIDLFHISGRF